MPRLSEEEAIPALSGGAEQRGCHSLQPCSPQALGTDMAFAAHAAGPTTHAFHSLETESLPFSSFIFTLSLLWLPHISALRSATDTYFHPRYLARWLRCLPVVTGEMVTTTQSPTTFQHPGKDAQLFPRA